MKKKMLFVGLLLPLLLTMLAPYPVLAKAQRPEPVPFTATADVMVTDPGKSHVVGARIFTRGEIIEGTMSAVQGWPELEGAYMEVKHNSEITLSPMANGVGTYQGSARALVNVSPLGGGRLFGIYQADLYGEYTVMDGQLVILWVQDMGTFSVKGKVVDKHGDMVEAEGDWAAALILTPISPTDYTLAGTAQLAGDYQVLKRSGK